MASSDKRQRNRKMSDAVLAKFSTYHILGLPDPLDWAQALKRSDAELWVEAGDVEDGNQKPNGTCVLVDRAMAK